MSREQIGRGCAKWSRPGVEGIPDRRAQLRGNSTYSKPPPQTMDNSLSLLEDPYGSKVLPSLTDGSCRRLAENVLLFYQRRCESPPVKIFSVQTGLPGSTRADPSCVTALPPCTKHPECRLFLLFQAPSPKY